MAVSCSDRQCLFGDTGICFKTGEPNACENATSDIEGEIERLTGSAALHEQEDSERSVIYPGIELGLDDVSKLLNLGSGFLVGILGDVDAGKTCFINALYLLFSSGAAESHDFAFGGSFTLLGFEDRVRGTRRWEAGRMPDRMSVHTNVADGRSAGFMHLDVFRSDELSRTSLILSDLPGEWTTQLIHNARHSDRFEFLKRADATIIMIEASNLVDPTLRHSELERQKTLIDRLVPLTARGRPLLIVVTKADKIEFREPELLDELASHAAHSGFSVSCQLISSFSSSPAIASGTGVLEVIGTLISSVQPQPVSEARGERLFGSLPVAQGNMR
ncbi:TRAFAC clade GTPase domain-containing protein [Bradyrhizobium sp. 25ACV]